MRLRKVFWFCLKLWVGLAIAWSFSSAMQAQAAPVRVALVGFVHPLAGDSPVIANKAEVALIAALGLDRRASVVDQSIVHPALKGIGYDGSINMSRDEARKLGSAIGCDFFVTGKLETYTRSDRVAEEHEEALIGLMIVDGRTGVLAVFDFISEKAGTRETAVAALIKTLAARAGSFVDRMSRFQLARSQVITSASASGKTAAESIEDLPDESSPLVLGFKPPEFLNRVKPDYTDSAERADITAIVEASAVFQANGVVGDIQILRWAGFGLDESAERAIRQLKFKAATRDGKQVSVRATVRYNFRRLNEVEPQQTPKPVDNPVPDLRNLFKRRPPASFR